MKLYCFSLVLLSFVLTSDGRKGKMSSNLENILNDVNKYINIKRDRKCYKQHFDSLQLQLFNELRSENPFKLLFNGHCLQGSYADNLKVSKPDEFDSVFILKLPYHNLAKIVEDNYHAGNVLIDVSKILIALEKDPKQDLILRHLKKWVTPKNFLQLDKIHSWLIGCFTKALTKMNRQIIFENFSSNLTHKNKGPSHMITVSGRYNYSVDFVPGFLFSEKQNNFKGIKGDWLAILKPYTGPNNEKISFRASFFNQENDIIKNTNNLKNALRMIKKFRDNHSNMANLKSYYIKTVFLRKASKIGNDTGYWNMPILHDLEETLISGKLPYFWNEHCNMYEPYTPKQIEEMRNCVHNAKSIIIRGNDNMTDVLRYQIYSLFLTADELKTESIKKPSAEKINKNKL